MAKLFTNEAPDMNPERFLAGDPVLIPADATEQQELRLRFPVIPPMKGSPEREAWDRLGMGDPENNE